MTIKADKPVIVIDGPAGAGKSSVAKRLAKHFSLPFLDTGAIYRALSWWLNSCSLPPEESDELRAKLKVFCVVLKNNGQVLACGEDVTSEIRTPMVDSIVSPYSALNSVRSALLGFQRDQASGGIVAEGRDMGTVVFPDADLKIFLTASPEARAERRYRERLQKGEPANYGDILDQVKKRDYIDSTRDVAPLTKAVDAVELDTTLLSEDEVVAKIIDIASGSI